MYKKILSTMLAIGMIIGVMALTVTTASAAPCDPTIETCPGGGMSGTGGGGGMGGGNGGMGA